MTTNELELRVLHLEREVAELISSKPKTKEKSVADQELDKMEEKNLEEYQAFLDQLYPGDYVPKYLEWLKSKHYLEASELSNAAPKDLGIDAQTLADRWG
jgi:hypothetical protein